MSGRGWLVVAGLWMGSGVGGALEVSAQDDPSGDRLRVFLDCQTFGCDFTYTRREIVWVDWVRDRRDGDVHLLVTSTQAGGGTVYEIAFVGLGDREGRNVTLSTLSSSTDTQDERRSLLVSRFKLGLASYAAETPVADLLTVAYQDPTAGRAGGGPSQPDPTEDPWNLWVFSARLGGSLNGQSRTKSTNTNGSFSANRTSEEWKFRLGTNFNYRENEFELSEELTFTSITRSMGGDILLVKSAGPHWGIGGRASVTSSTFSNYDLRFTLQPAVEYNVFPYEESSRRSFTFQYRAGPRYARYDEETIFNKLSETTYEHQLSTSLGLQQPWGSASVSLAGTTFLDDFDKNQLSLFGSLNLRIVRGLSLNFFGSGSRVRNQINLPLGDATDEEVLLRQIVLRSGFTYFFNVSLRYTFGSIFNNIVNPRLDGGGGQFFFF
jgi:Protein of unknown function, DUF481